MRLSIASCYTLLVLFSSVGCSHLSSPNQSLGKQEIKQIVEEATEKQILKIEKIINDKVLPKFQEMSHLPAELIGKQKEAQQIADKKIIIGRVEWIKIDSNEFEIKARVDTGAQTTSMHAQNIVKKQIDGKDFIQFETLDDRDKKHVFLKEVIKETRVRNSDGNVSDRYVVQMQIKIGGQRHQINVNLNDRTDLTYKFLIGRNLLMGNYIVDVSQSRLMRP